MASYFGEVILPSSRAFWNDDEDDDALNSGQDDVEFSIKWIESEPAEIEKFLVVEGEMVHDYINFCLLQNAKVVCTVGYESEKNDTKIYLVDNNMYVCIISTKLNLAQAGKLTETVSPLLRKCKNIMTMTSDHLSHYKSEEEVESSSILKTLYSSKARSKNLKSTKLTQPNIVTGVCAGVLTYAEIANLSCIMYILYTDTFTLDSKNASPLTDLLTEIIGKPLPSFTSGSSSFFNKGNLYL